MPKAFLKELPKNVIDFLYHHFFLYDEITIEWHATFIFHPYVLESIMNYLLFVIVYLESRYKKEYQKHSKK